MIKTQIQIPDNLYQEVKRIAAEREMSMAEVVRRGLEYIVAAYPEKPSKKWTIPTISEGMVREDIDQIDLKKALDESDIRL